MWLLKSIQGGLIWSAGVDVALKLFDRLLYFFYAPNPNAYFNLQELR